MDGDLRIRMSCGSAVFPREAHTRQELLALADARLYRAKARGEGVVPRAEGRSERAVGVYGVLDRILDTLQQRDNFTRRHCEKTAEYAVALAQELGLSTSAQRTLRLGGLLHDIGKIGIPARMRDRGPGEPQDPALIEHQLAIAENLIADVPNAEEVRRVIRDHHASWDGSGYPEGMGGKDIPLLARVLAVADSYSAITLGRPGVTPADAYQILQAEAGARLDPEFVQRFGNVLTNRRERDEAGHTEATVP
jgi:putative nucleotidyltransferase with HDIG domain